MSSPIVESPQPLATALLSFGRVYWIANWMELVERFAYYGVRVVLPVFMVAAFAEGGPEFNHLQKGQIYAIWALVQSFVPIFTGGFADRYGFKLNIVIATVLKIVGYLVMGYAIPMAEALCGMPLAEARPLGADRTFEIFFAGAMFLALGTAVFKPGLQGLIAHEMPTRNASLGWGLFYQMVNIGGFIGPLLAGYLRVLDWQYVFLACSVGIALNFIPLFFFDEPKREAGSTDRGPLAIMWDAVRGLLEPRLFYFTICFAGFWLMFFQLFDILPNFIDDWVDSRGAASFLGGILGEGTVPVVNGGNLTQEWMINVNALLISIFAFVIGYFSGKMESLFAIIVGIAISAVAIYGLGMSIGGWWCIGAIALFSLGEMLASPTKMRYVAAIAPPGRQGLYMGYVNMTVGIGWSLGSVLAGELYQTGGDKVVLARRYLAEKGMMSATDAEALGKGDVLPAFERLVGVDAWQTRQLLWDAYHPGSMWLIFTGIGVASLVAICLYTWLVRVAAANPRHSFNTHGLLWVRGALVPIVGVLLWFAYDKLAVQGDTVQDSLAVLVQAAMFGLLLVASFMKTDSDPSG